MEKLTGINEQNMKSLILDIYECRDKISKILNDAQFLMEKTKDYYLSEDGDLIRRKFNELCYNNKILLNNIKGYGEDLEKVMFNYKKLGNKTNDIFKYNKSIDITRK